MRVAVSDTSPLTSLAAVGQFDLLRRLFGELHIPEGVWEELNAYGERHPGSQEVEAATWIHRHPIKNSALVVALRQDLDRGEAEALALAVELNADVVLVDEKEGRHAAARLGLKPLGVLGLLLEGKRRQEIVKVRPVLDALRQRAGFFIQGELYRWVLDQAGEGD